MSCTLFLSSLHNSLILPTLFITYLTFFAVTAGRHHSSSSAAALVPAPASESSSALIAIMWLGSSSKALALRSLNISAVP
ncbi:hypothetical protein BDR07DRAFT_1560129 [Suillus spraguei]|nr:hypothetical protein BDR07DRAFT_1560129 [Suillus spraguei]